MILYYDDVRFSFGLYCCIHEIEETEGCAGSGTRQWTIVPFEGPA